MKKARKYDGQKIRLELISTLAIEEIAKVLTFGAEKYDADNWRNGFAHRRLIGALLRHVFAHMRGEDRDSESGLLHLAHAGCCLMFLLEHVLAGIGDDDRWNERGKMPQAKVSVPRGRGRNRG